MDTTTSAANIIGNLLVLISEVDRNLNLSSKVMTTSSGELFVDLLAGWIHPCGDKVGFMVQNQGSRFLVRIMTIAAYNGCCSDETRYYTEIEADDLVGFFESMYIL